MKKNEGNKQKHIMRVFQSFLYGCLTGIACGVVITLFVVCARVVFSFAQNIYSAERTLLGVVCIITLVVGCCLLAAVIQTLCPSGKGSGIPLAVGGARGMLRVKWLRSAAGLIAGSILSFAAGLSLGSEGPSIGVGGLIGEGIGKAAKKPPAFRRGLITGGASAGLAVAFNAPLTGVAFALEETHRRFSPALLLAAFSSVIPAVLTSQLILWGLGFTRFGAAYDVHALNCALHSLAQTPYKDITSLLAVCLVAMISGAAIGGLAALYNYCIFFFGKQFAKIRRPLFRLAPAFLFTAATGLFLAKSIGSGEATFEFAYTSAATWLLFVLLAIRFISTVAASGSGATGGLFLPMIAIGGISGVIAAKAAVCCGVDGVYVSNIVMLCISAFFAASTSAPISAVIMSVELTASFSNLLPCAVAVAVATAVSGLLRTAPLYERMTENLCNTTEHEGTIITVVGTVPIESVICGKRIRDILWPYNSLVVRLDRGGTEIVPDGETTIEADDKLTIRAENVEPNLFNDQIKDYIVQNLQ